MAQRLTTVDDLDPEQEAVKTVLFTWAGKDYEIDLSAAHVAEFEDLMGRYVRAARPAGRPPKVLKGSTVRPAPPRPPLAVVPHSQPAPSTRDDNWWRYDRTDPYRVNQIKRQWRRTMRDWVRAHGWPGLGDTGIIPQEAIDAYFEAHPEHRHRHIDDDDDADTESEDTVDDAEQPETHTRPAGRKLTTVPRGGRHG